MGLDRADFDAAREPISRAKSMPAGFYSDPAIFAAEREKIFLRDWFFLCRTEMLPNAGDYRAFATAGGVEKPLRRLFSRLAATGMSTVITMVS